MSNTDKLSYKIEDMILQLDKSVNPKKFRISDYQKFIDLLCGNREYQKSAIRNVFNFLFSDTYDSIEELADRNYQSNSKIRDRYQQKELYISSLQFPKKKAAAVDLPTAAGKSYVMYGVARIALAAGLVDRVLIICPSITIEAGLNNKFLSLIADSELNELLRRDDLSRIPSIINGNETFIDNAICIENFHSILPNTGSSIRDNLRGRGLRTLILNDECHHVYNSSDSETKKWKDFLSSNEFNFQYIIGFSGTCYVGNDYFTDVIFRLPLLDLIEMGFAKDIDYVTEDNSEGESEKFQKVYNNHLNNKRQYRKVKPLTIFVTQNIDSCKRLAQKFTAFVAEQESISLSDAETKVLVATSAKDHIQNIIKLEMVDSQSSPVEWIFSVSMLTEGWDVKNVFQIVPHEERAFNSKLLISQVLGRGLRVPDEYRGERPVVKVFNHSSWSPRIKNLVDSLLEIENRAYYGPCAHRAEYNFSIHNLDKKIDLIETEKNDTYATNVFEKDSLVFRDVALTSQEEYLDRETVYSRIGEKLSEAKTTSTKIRYKMHSVAEVAGHIFGKIQSIDIEQGTNYTDKYSISFLVEFIERHLEKIGDLSGMLNDKNRQILQGAFELKDVKGSTNLRYGQERTDLITVSTENIPPRNVSQSFLKSGDGTIFYVEDSIEFSGEPSRTILRTIIEDYSLPRSALIEITNIHTYKTSFNFVSTSGKPEREFVRRLTSLDTANAIDAWVKSSDVGFYSIDYDYITKGISRDRTFNPDFFIKKDNHIFVVEIKDDGEMANPSEKNRAKFYAGKKHFDQINSIQSDIIYHFNFLSPSDFDIFFSHVRKGNYEIVSSLDAYFLNNS